MLLFESLGMVSYSPSIATMAISLAVCEKEWCGLENMVQGHWKWHHLIDRIRVPISIPLFQVF